MSIFLLVLGLVLFVGLVVVHELGHFIVARRNGVEAEEFGVGFPPALYRKRVKSKRGDFDFTWNLLPLGGFVRLKGEHDADTEKGSFGAANTWSKTKIMAAGVVMNLITAYVLFMIVALIGMPQLVDDQFTVASDSKTVSSQLFVGYVEPSSPASSAGLKSGDRLQTISSSTHTISLDSNTQLPTITKSFAGETVNILYSRQGDERQTTAKLRTTAEVADSQNTKNPKGYLGVVPSTYSMVRSTWSAPIVAGGVIVQFTGLTFQGLGKALAGLGGIVAGFVTGNGQARHNAQTEASSQVAGPVGIFFILKDGSLLGYEYVLFIVAIISLTLAIMNILPIPALDGGRLWLTLASRAVNKPLSQRTEEIVNATGFAILMLLILLITFVDVRRFF
ncbi:site-2 protease family protein [Candidatus Saccharibacteria bacterium]|nr:site-2 protease family protein [Candidatus Saccharibacteria bacterium]